MTPDLDDTDNRILALLMDDARLPVTSIAKHVGLARTTIIARISNLEKRGIITGYGVRLNPERFQPALRAYVSIVVDPQQASTMVGLLEQMAEVETLCAVSGAVDYILTLRCASTAALDRLLDRIGATAGVRQTSTSIILSKRIDRSTIG